MNAKHYYDRSAELTLSHPWYREQVERFVLKSYYSDATNDLTAKQLIARQRNCKAQVIAKQVGIIAGLEEVLWLCKHEGVQAKTALKDGQKVPAGKIILKLECNARTLLKLERTALNTLQHLSGVATLTKRYVDLVAGHVLVAATRKTVWGALDKKAVAAGGGYTHRLHLADGVLVKDNHWALLEHDELKSARWGKQLCGLEVASFTQLKRAVVHYPQFKVIMLDNFTPDKVKQAIQWLTTQKVRRQYTIEASGGINFSTIKAFAKTGADVLSIGALTHSATALDLSLDIIP